LSGINLLDSFSYVFYNLSRLKSQEWVQKHYKTLTPMVTAAAEGLTGMADPSLHFS